MTYTFKLARRLAVARRFAMLPAILLFASCSGDTTAPETRDPLGPQRGVTVSVNPSKVTIETNQLIRFLAYGRNSAGDSVHAPITWRATGGTILPDGRFSSAAVGSFMVTGAIPDRDDERVDTSFVSVVRRHPLLSSIEIAPESVTLAPGVSQWFLVTGRLTNGRAVAVGTRWNATGGTIDAGGNYVAGDTAGTYQVIATNASMSVSDTALVTITAPPSPPPPPPTAPPEEPPAPVLQKVTLVPASATLAPSASRQFTAYGQTTDGDSIAVSVVFTANGGTVTAGGLYTAGATAGTYRVVATLGTLADTSTLTVTRPLGSGPAAGIPFGPYAAWNGTSLKANTESFTATIGSINASDIIAQIAEARSNKVRLILNMTGGGHGNYMSVINGVLQFDRTRWDAKMETFNTPTIKAAIAAGVTDGTIIGANVMDEPNVSGGGDGNTWGPPGTLTKARVDGLCAYVKAIFPSIPVGVAHAHGSFEPDKSYKTCEFVLTQYHTRKGDVTQFRDDALAMGRRDGHEIAFSINTLSGGIQAKRDGLWNCPAGTTGGRGTYDPNCKMTPQQIREFARILGPHGCALIMWRYDAAMMADPEYKQAFRDVAAMMAAAPARSCRRG